MEDEIMTNEQFWEIIKKTKYETLDELLIRIEAYEGITTQEIIYMIKALKKELSQPSTAN